MKVLAMDTSTSWGALGLCDDGHVLGEMALVSKEGYAARLLPAIDWLLGTLHLKVSDVDVFGVTLGPGSFTGLRVGLSTAKGLAFALNKPLVGLSSLELLARNAPNMEAAVVPTFDARRSEIYAAAFDHRSGDFISKMAPMVLPPDELAEKLQGTYYLVGEGCRRYEEVLRSSSKGRARFLSPEYDVPRGGVAAKLAYEAYKAGATLSVETAEPVYIRSSVAEENMRKVMA